ncbi:MULTISPECIES: hypothetical protein [unclassified Bradyrhizobium]|uniref:hypothetical protein n=1 Tax=unclassified Bradyrhizobium TaxID=2631580 RepID=UPI002478D5AD|nr:MULTISPECIES: hypothetical protein [unclassified Bradyrhizobium]WGR69522.1 hypothetical protein MTX24_29440 [Bradyrhizobium sp. ISRA426]WGR81578.1 hypothetical protein MTX21_14550 [Bradyrhizobium sp. ISRA430]WGR84762.1 hypothetical protein MTX25_29115 [Bradyrhizobium sp. ISRA432]
MKVLSHCIAVALAIALPALPSVLRPGSGLVGSAQAAEETVQTMLAAQIRTQGFTCEKALGATKDAKRSKPDHDVWVLKCSNANYRVSRAPDMAAKVVPLE